MRSYMTVAGLLLLNLYGVQVTAAESFTAAQQQSGPLSFLGTVNGDVELGFLYTTGNTDSFAVRVNSELVHDLEYFRNRYQVSGRIQRNNVLNTNSGNKERVTATSRYAVSGQSNYKFVTGRQMVFGRGSYQHDRFGSFKEQASVAAGYGNRVYEDGTDYLDLETGPGFAHQQSASDVTNTGLIWFLAMNLDYHLFENSKFRQVFEGAVSLNGQNSTYLSRSSLTAKVNGRLSMRINYIIKYNSRPEGDLDSMDTETSASLVYSF